MVDLSKRSLLTLLDFSAEEIGYLLELAVRLKNDKYTGRERKTLQGKNIVLLFEKDSTRTRCSFEVAAYDQGARVTYLGPTGSQVGKKESIKDTARVLGRMYDGIEYRGFSQNLVEELSENAGVPVWNGLTDEFHPTQMLADLMTIEYRGFAQRIVHTLAEYSGVPVWNGLTNEFHPTQALADMMTMREHTQKPLSEWKICFLGDAHNNVANSLMVASAKMGMDFRAVSPVECAPDASLVRQPDAGRAERREDRRDGRSGRRRRRMRFRLYRRMGFDGGARRNVAASDRFASAVSGQRGRDGGHA